MNNPTLDRAAAAIAATRDQPHVASLEDVEKMLAKTLEDDAPELDRTLAGAAWMLLANALGELLGQQPNLPPKLLVHLGQLAGQRLYTGTDLPREVPCPVVRSSGSRCPFTAKAVTPDLVDAQMRGHYATYHEHLTWAPECGGAPSELVAAIGFTQPCRLPRGHAEPCRHGEARDRVPIGVRVSDYPRPEADMHGRALGPGKCARCGEEKPQFNVFAWGGFLCEECVQALAIGLPELPEGATFTPLPDKPTPHEYDGMLTTLDGEYAGSAEAVSDSAHPGWRSGLEELAEKPTPQSVREGRHTLDEFRRAYRLPVFEIPEGVFPEAVGPLLEAAFAEAERAYHEQEHEQLPEGAIGRCRRCARPVGVAPAEGLLPAHATVHGIECSICQGVVTPQEMRDELAKDGG